MPVWNEWQLRWPAQVFQQRAGELVELAPKGDTWVRHLLWDAFSTDEALQEFTNRRNEAADPWRGGASSSGGEIVFLQQLVEHANQFPRPAARLLYSQRRNQTQRPGLSHEAQVARFVRLVAQLDERGYFERVFGKECRDDPDGFTGLTGLDLGPVTSWPLTPEPLTADRDAFLDTVEVLHEIIAAPRDAHFHDYGGCGWHYSDFSTALGRAVYRALVNELLTNAEAGLCIADEGEECGLLVEVTDEAREELLLAAAAQDDPSDEAKVKHAIRLFRARDASPESKWTACYALAAILESRRELLKSHLLSKDEGALFQIANQFAVRHNNDAQRSDYDPVFLDWIFWWYLATIQLSSSLLRRDIQVQPEA